MFVRKAESKVRNFDEKNQFQSGNLAENCFNVLCRSFFEFRKNFIDEDLVLEHLQARNNLEKEQGNLRDSIYSGSTQLLGDMFTKYVAQKLPDSY